jgi:hypothetical protein
MEIVESAVSSALIVAIQTGMPVSILFIIGYLAYRAEGRKRAGVLGSSAAGSAVAGRRGDSAVGNHCWEVRKCAADHRPACPAFQHPEVACWQATKESLGRLKSECLNCERCVAPPTER